MNFFSQYMLLWLRNAMVHNLPLEEQISRYQRHESLPDSLGVATVTFAGGGSIHNANLNVISGGVVTNQHETYTNFGYVLGEPNEQGYRPSYMVTYRNGRIVVIGTYLLNVEFDETYLLTSVSDIQFTFDPALPMEETPWAIELFQPDN